MLKATFPWMTCLPLICILPIQLLIQLGLKKIIMYTIDLLMSIPCLLLGQEETYKK